MSLQKRQWLLQFSQQSPIPPDHGRYLQHLRSQGVYPRVIWDVGACVLHWYHLAKKIWPNADYYMIDGNTACEFLYQQEQLKYQIAVVSNSDRRSVTFWQNDTHVGGSSYYRENYHLCPESKDLFTEEQKQVVCCQTLQTISKRRAWPLPDFLKLDVQGAELDVLQGLLDLNSVEHIVLELQHVEWNLGAPHCSEVITWLEDHNFELIAPRFSNNGPDADYHFKRKLV